MCHFSAHCCVDQFLTALWLRTCTVWRVLGLVQSTQLSGMRMNPSCLNFELLFSFVTFNILNWYYCVFRMMCKNVSARMMVLLGHIYTSPVYSHPDVCVFCHQNSFVYSLIASITVLHWKFCQIPRLTVEWSRLITGYLSHYHCQHSLSPTPCTEQCRQVLDLGFEKQQ